MPRATVRKVIEIHRWMVIPLDCHTAAEAFVAAFMDFFYVRGAFD